MNSSESNIEKYVAEPLRHWFGSIATEGRGLFLVGGAIRDMHIGLQPADLDLVCQGAKVLADALSKKNGVSVAIIEKKAGEKTFRLKDRFAPSYCLDITELNSNGICEDLKRRDYTINSIAIRVYQGGGLGEVIDPSNGQSDLKSKQLRVTSESSFSEDSVRILRGIRLAGELGFKIDEETQNAMRVFAPALSRAGVERISMELLRLLKDVRSAKQIGFSDKVGVLSAVFPEIIPMKGCTQNTYHHLDVWQHSLAVFENCEFIMRNLPMLFKGSAQMIAHNLAQNDRAPLLKMAALFHDVGKPSTRDVNAGTQRITFYGHDRAGAEIIGAIADRLKFSTKSVRFLQKMVSEHLHVLNLSENSVRPATITRFFRRLKDDAIPAIILGMADMKGTLGPDSKQDSRNRHLIWSEKIISNYYAQLKRRFERKDLISGRDLIALGVEPSPKMAHILKEVRLAQDEGIVCSVKDALALVKMIINQK